MFEKQKAGVVLDVNPKTNDCTTYFAVVPILVLLIPPATCNVKELPLTDRVLKYGFVVGAEMSRITPILYVQFCWDVGMFVIPRDNDGDMPAVVIP